MNRRTQFQLRRFVDLTLAMLDMGVFDVRGAARHLADFNVPIHVALRVIAGRTQ